MHTQAHIHTHHGSTVENCIVDINFLGPCSEGDVRLSGGQYYTEGRVEICLNNQWGTVSSNFWSTSNGNVVCRQLGFSPTGKHIYLYTHNYSMSVPLTVNYIMHLQVQLLIPLLPLVRELALSGLIMCTALVVKVN